MKIRTDFVTNSSSSSFVVSIYAIDDKGKEKLVSSLQDYEGGEYTFCDAELVTQFDFNNYELPDDYYSLRSIDDEDDESRELYEGEFYREDFIFSNRKGECPEELNRALLEEAAYGNICTKSMDCIQNIVNGRDDKDLLTKYMKKYLGNKICQYRYESSYCAGGEGFYEWEVSSYLNGWPDHIDNDEDLDVLAEKLHTDRESIDYYIRFLNHELQSASINTTELYDAKSGKLIESKETFY